MSYNPLLFSTHQAQLEDSSTVGRSGLRGQGSLFLQLPVKCYCISRRYKPSVLLTYFNCKLKWLIPGECQLIVEGPLSHSVPIHMTEVLPYMQHAETIEAPMALTLAPSSSRFHSARGKPRKLEGTAHPEPREVAQRCPR